MGDLGQTPLNSGAPGDEADSPRANARSHDVAVLVTGFGAFKSFDTNPSWLIAKQLEGVLPPILDPDDPSRSIGPTIHLFVHPEPVRVSYPVVFDVVPDILSSFPIKIDYILNIGMAAGRKYYSLESLAHRDGYKIKDVDGELPTAEEKYWKEEVRAPAILRPDLDLEEVFARWRSQVNGMADVRVSTDAGGFLCDFIFYTSMVTQRSRHEAKKSLFLHVPGGTDQATVDKGALLATALIRAMVGDGTEIDPRTEIAYAEDAGNGGEL